MPLPAQYRWLAAVAVPPRMVAEALTTEWADCFVGRPAFENAPINPARRYAVSLRRFYDCQPLSAELIYGAAALVALLLLPLGPAAIIGVIGAVVILAIKSSASRARPHVGQEVGEAFEPAGANRYPAPSIARVFLSVGSVATPLHL